MRKSNQRIVDVKGAEKLKALKHENLSLTATDIVELSKVARATMMSFTYNPEKEFASFIERTPQGISFHNIIKEPNNHFTIVIKKTNERMMLDKWTKVYRNPMDIILKEQEDYKDNFDDFVNDEALLIQKGKR